jgi:NTP pyrophosphatase (non-canonical NTP hydrolase)
MGMDASDYQYKASRTLIQKPDFIISDKGIMLVWCAIGLTGEAGEVAEVIKKGVFHQHGLDREKLLKEIGDTLWYLAGLCSVLDVDISTVMEQNIEKLRIRYPDGFSAEASRRRVDVE